MSARKADHDYSARLEPEEVSALMALEDYGDLARLSRMTGRAIGTLTSKRQELRNAALRRRLQPDVFLTDDEITFAARMTQIYKGQT